MSIRVAQKKQKKIEEIAHRTAAQLGYEIYKLNAVFKKNSLEIDVKIDSLDNVSHDDCVAFTRSFMGLLDAEEDFGSYTVSVSSPGLKRELRTEKDYLRFVGAPVKVIYRDEASDKSVVVKGKLESYEKQVIKVSPEKKLKNKADSSYNIESGFWEIDISKIISVNLDY